VKINDYHRELNPEEIERGEHRDFVGGMWDEIGRLQFDFMVARGLKRDMRLLDIGCGSFRGGIHFVRYLKSGNYFGIDGNHSLIASGYEKEMIPSGLAEKLPPENLLVDADFAFSRFATTFHAALAVSVFTHLPLNHIRLCLINLSKCMAPGARFFATIFQCPEGRPVEDPLTHTPGGITTFSARDPYHYRVSDMARCTGDLPWTLQAIGDWGHPRAQRMIRFVRTS